MGFCCDCDHIPESDEDVIIVEPDSCTFWNGLSRSYSKKFDRERFAGRLRKQDFDEVIEEINEVLFYKMPSPICWCIGHLIAIPTLGISMCFMHCCCVSEAEKMTQKKIKQMNNNVLRKRGWEV